MKLIFKIILITLTLKVNAAQIIIYYPTVNHQFAAKNVKEIFERSYLIPKQLIHLKKNVHCEMKDKRFLEVCIKENFQLVEIENKKQEEIKRSLLIFSKKTEVSYVY